MTDMTTVFDDGHPLGRAGRMTAEEATARVGEVALLMQLSAIGYWLVFWAMNGLDKFLNRTDLGLFTWHGKDRTDQFTGYFERMGLDPQWIPGLLTTTGIWELVIAALLALAVVCVLRGPLSAAAARVMNWGFALSVITFVGFSLFDVIVGDRAELREHGLYLILVLVAWVVAWGAERARV